MRRNKEIVGILGHGEIGSAIARICREAGYQVFVRDLDYDQLAGKKVDYLHVNVPEKTSKQFVNLVVKNIKELSPQLTIVNSSVTPGTTRKIYQKTKTPIVHSPVIGLHPNLYESIKKHFQKVVGPINKESEKLAKAHFKKLGLRAAFFKKPENSETAKLLDLVYFAWNIVFCKWVDRLAKEKGWDFDEIYKRHNEIYNEGYKKLLPNSVRPILVPMPGPITGHCTIPDTMLFHKLYPSRLTKFVLEENNRYFKEVDDLKKQRKQYLRLRSKMMKK